MNGLGRETNVLAVFAQPLPRRIRDLARLGAAAIVVALPLLVWQDYLRLILDPIRRCSTACEARWGFPGCRC